MTTISDADTGLAFERFPDLASRSLGGSVTHANDELFAQRENLIKPEPSRRLGVLGNKGGEYDGWETRRRRTAGHDYAVVRLGVPGRVMGVIVDTAHFLGNYPPHISVEGANIHGYSTPAEIDAADWATLVPRAAAKGGVANPYACSDKRVFTHVRLSIYPDGGVARFRVHGEPVPDPRFLEDTIDLAALENGGRVLECSDTFYSSPMNILLPDRARNMGDGWETSRRRDDGNDFVVIRLAGAGQIRQVEIDTSYFIGNAPGWVRLLAASAPGEDAPHDWTEILPRRPVCPDTRHRFLHRAGTVATHVRVDIYPDGGLSRLRVHGQLTDAARAAATTSWFNALPERAAADALAAAGIEAKAAGLTVGGRPCSTPSSPAGSVDDVLRTFARTQRT